MYVALVTTVLLVLVGASEMNADEECCIPHTSPYLKFSPERQITDYVKLDNAVSSNLDATTVCLNFRHDPFANIDGTMHPFSYATPGVSNGNTLLLQTVPAIRIILNGHHIITQYVIEDGNWHQMCFTWQSSDGAWKLYDYGELVAEGTGLNTGGIIRAGGTLVLGQDQDNVGDKFDANQAFLGYLSEVNMWGTVLSASDIRAMYEPKESCRITDGSVIRWAQLIVPEVIHGGVQKICG